MCIFPEGCTTNGKALMRLKRGAFDNLNAVQPIYIKYKSPFCNASFDMLQIVEHVLFMCCQPFTITEIHRLPIVFPTKEMFNKFGGKDKNATDVYSSVVRDIYCKKFGLKVSKLGLLDKDKLEKHVYKNEKMKFD